MNSRLWYKWDDWATSRVVVVSDMFFTFSSLASPSMQQVLCTSRQPTATALRQHMRVGATRRDGWG